MFFLVAAVRAAGEEDRWWLLLIQGILDVLANTPDPCGRPLVP